MARPAALLVQRRFDIVSFRMAFIVRSMLCPRTVPKSQRSRGRCPMYRGNLRRGSLGRYMVDPLCDLDLST